MFQLCNSWEYPVLLSNFFDVEETHLYSHSSIIPIQSLTILQLVLPQDETGKPNHVFQMSLYSTLPRFSHNCSAIHKSTTTLVGPFLSLMFKVLSTCQRTSASCCSHALNLPGSVFTRAKMIAHHHDHGCWCWNIPYYPWQWFSRSLGFHSHPLTRYESGGQPHLVPIQQKLRCIRPDPHYLNSTMLEYHCSRYCSDSQHSISIFRFAKIILLETIWTMPEGAISFPHRDKFKQEN